MKDFNKLYKEIYINYSADLTKAKKEKSLKHIILCIMCISLMIAWMTGQNNIFGIVGIGFSIWLVISMIYQQEKYKLIYRKTVIKMLIEFCSSQFKYNPVSGIPESIYKDAGFKESYNLYKSKGLAEGNILENCKTIMTKVHTKGIYSRNNTTVFNGIFAKVEMPKTLSFELNICKNSEYLIQNEKQKLRMDYNEFEKIFDINTNNKIQAMRLLTLDVMQMLMDFVNENIIMPEITLKENKIYARFYVGNMFEPKDLEDDMNYERLKEHYNTINAIFNLIEQFTRNVNEFDE